MRTLADFRRLIARPQPGKPVGFSVAAVMVAATTAFAPVPALAKGNEKPAKKEVKAEKPKGPFIVVVSIGRQRLTVWGPNGNKVTESPVSSGQPGHETPQGVFSIIGKEEMHHSNLYNDAPMPWMQRITWSGVAMHAGNLPGYPASHGCIRLPYNFSKTLFGITPMATRVIVTRESPTPTAFTHPQLFTPLPPAASLTPNQTPIPPQDQQPAPGPVASAAGLTPPSRLGGPATADALPVPAPITVASLAGAAGPDAKPRRTREQIQAERTARIEKLTADLKTAEARRIEAEPAAKAAAVTLNDARTAQRAVKLEADALTQAQQKITRQIAAANAELAAMAKSHAKLTKDEDIDRAADRERLIEEKLLILGADADKARAAVEAHAGKVAEAARKVQDAEKARLAAIDALKQSAETLRQTRVALETAKREEANYAKPITVLISRKTGKLHVRQANEDLFEAPVTIESPQSPFGTHVLTALELVNGERELSWSALTVKGSEKVAEEAPKRKKGKKDEPAPVAPAAAEMLPQTPAKALERIKIPEDAQEKIAEFIKPGSSIIITDNGISHETGKGTDYVILTKGN